MPNFSARSLKHLGETHPELQRLFNMVVQYYDCTVLDGARTVEEQKENVRRGVSRTMNSKHFLTSDGGLAVSMAVDVIPYPIDWNNTRRITYFAGFVRGVATMLEIPIRWGGDWDSDNDLSDQIFNDLVHYELCKNS